AGGAGMRFPILCKAGFSGSVGEGVTSYHPSSGAANRSANLNAENPINVATKANMKKYCLIKFVVFVIIQWTFLSLLEKKHPKKRFDLTYGFFREPLHLSGH